MNPTDVFQLLNLKTPGMAKIQEALAASQPEVALIALRDYLAARLTPVLYGNSDPINLVNHISQHYPQEIEETLKIADEITRQEFLFRGRWDMERTHHPVRFEDKIPWDVIPADDEEWCFMLNRHKYWTSLGQAYILTGNEAYAQTFFSQLEDWIDSNPLEERFYRKSWRTLEAGIRMENWVKTLQFTLKSPHFSPQLAGKLIQSMRQHGQYIIDNYNHFRRLSNWGVIENHGLFVLSVFLPELQKSSQWQKAALARLEEEILIQCLGDGTQWEQSPLYHNEVLRCYLDLLNLAEKNGIKVPDAIPPKVKKMAYVDLYMARPDHQEPLLGDSDEVDLRDVLSLSAFLFKDGQLKFGGYPSLDYESLWDLGYGACQLYESLPSQIPSFSSYGFEDAGNYYLRSGWGEKDSYLSFRCGYHGGGHGHADTLHIDLSAYGDNLLTDLGRFTYVEGNPWRDYFKSSSSHNVPRVDAHNFTDLVGSWLVKKAALPLNVKYITTAEYDYVEGGHLGYLELADPVVVTRKILFLKPSCWILMDEFHGKQSHTFTQHYHFGLGQAQKQADGITFEGDHARLRLIPLDKSIQTEVKEDFISRQYNLKEPSQQALFTLQGTGFTSMGTLLWAEPLSSPTQISWEPVAVFRGNGRDASPQQAQAFKIRIADEESIIFFAYQEPAQKSPAPLWVVDNIPLFAKVALIRKTQEGYNTTPIRY